MYMYVGKFLEQAGVAIPFKYEAVKIYSFMGGGK